MSTINMVAYVAAVAAYGMAAVFYEVFFVTKNHRYSSLAILALTIGVAVHGLAFVARWIVIERVTLASLFEAMSFYVWATAVVYIVVERIYGVRTLGAFLAPLAFFFAISALLYPSEIREVAPVLQVGFFRMATHVIVSFFAFAFFTMAFASAVVYLLQERGLKLKKPYSLLYRLPPLERMQHVSYVMVALGFPAMLLTVITGALWAHDAWGTFWTWDPKQSLSLASLLIYTLYLHARNIAGWSGRRSAWLLVLGFVAVLVTFVGVNLFAPGQHNFQ